MNEVQRTLGRMEGQQGQILQLVKDLQEKIGDHIDADQAAFSTMRVSISEQKTELLKQFKEQSDERTKRLDAQDETLTQIMSYINWAKGASWPILGLLGLIGLVLVGILVSLIAAWWKLGKV